jgi:hypothetical protein
MSKNTTTSKTTAPKVVAPTPVVEATPVVETPVIDTPDTAVQPVVEPVVPRKFAANDYIRCVSITSGELLMIGEKTKSLYRWADRGDEQDVEYQDLIYATRANSGFVFKPRFIIDDEEFLRQNPSVKAKYETMYTLNDIQDVLALNPQDMKQTILSLPDGAKESIKSMAATMIANGTLDSVTKIKILDEIFDTQLMLMTELL